MCLKKNKEIKLRATNLACALQPMVHKVRNTKVILQSYQGT